MTVDLERWWWIASSDDQIDHAVTRKANGTWICSCRGYRYNPSCRHIAAAKQLLEEANRS